MQGSWHEDRSSPLSERPREGRADRHHRVPVAKGGTSCCPLNISCLPQQQTAIAEKRPLVLDCLP